MNIKELKQFLPFAFKTNISVMVHGLHGIGKSQAIKQYAEENGMEFIDRRLSQMESGDLLGLPDVKDGTTRFITPSWLPQDKNSKGVLFLDEINRARRDVLQGVFQLVLDRQLGDYRLPDGWQVISAVNPNTDEYDVTQVFDAALLDRFLHISLKPTTAEYIQYLQSNKSLEQNYVLFLQSREELIEVQKNKNEEFFKRLPSRRSNYKAAELLAAGLPEHLQYEGLAGLVGSENAVAFGTWMKENDIKPFTAKEIIGDFSKIEERVKKYTDKSMARADVMTQSLDNLFNHLVEKKGKLTEKQFSNAMVFVEKVPRDLGKSFMQRVLGTDDKDLTLSILENMIENPGTDWIESLEDPTTETKTEEL
jgi:hypothetical protein